MQTLVALTLHPVDVEVERPEAGEAEVAVVIVSVLGMVAVLVNRSLAAGCAGADVQLIPGVMPDTHAEVADTERAYLALLEFEVDPADVAGGDLAVGLRDIGRALMLVALHYARARCLPLVADDDLGAVVAKLRNFEELAQGEGIKFGVAVTINASTQAAYKTGYKLLAEIHAFLCRQKISDGKLIGRAVSRELR